ncbi:hypothetical protein CRV24_006445 [Beauveria bassiana]|nr:hypothetical protein CRV24_006445 [Beauveria bassiana]KAH8713423.1 hypothetical protein HC256_006582 [Beauveria bassiana]
MPREFTFKPYVPKPAPKAEQRAAGTEMPRRTDTRDETSAPSDGFDAPSRAVIRDEIDAPGLGVDEPVPSKSPGEETIATYSSSAVLGTEPQLGKTVQENSVHLSQTGDFEMLFRQGKSSSEQPGNKRVQQPTPEYDVSDPEDARRKRPRLAGEVLQNTPVDESLVPGVHEKQRVPESDDRRQAAVHELASPIIFGDRSKSRHTAENQPAITRSNNDACATQTRSLVSVLGDGPPPLRCNGTDPMARTQTPSSCSLDCCRAALGGDTIRHHAAMHGSALVKRPMATQCQPSSWDAAALEKRAAALEKQAAVLDERAERLDERTERLNKRAERLDERAACLDAQEQLVASMKQRAADPDQTVTESYQQVAASSRQPSRERGQKAARQWPDFSTTGYSDEGDSSGSDDSASVSADEEDACHQVKATYHTYNRGPLSQKEKTQLGQWNKGGKSHQWIATQLNRKPENIRGLLDKIIR